MVAIAVKLASLAALAAWAPGYWAAVAAIYVVLPCVEPIVFGRVFRGRRG